MIQVVEAIHEAYKAIPDNNYTTQHCHIKADFNRVTGHVTVETYSAIFRITEKEAILRSDSEKYKSDSRIPIDDPDIVNKILKWCDVDRVVEWANRYHI